MNCFKNQLVLSWVVAFFIAGLSFCMLSYYYKEKYENNKSFPLWHNEATEEFFRLFQRPIDPVHFAYYKRSTHYLSPQKSMLFIKNDMQKYKQEVEEGKKKAKGSKVIVAGLLQNGAYHIPELKERCQKIVGHFKDYRIIILENNSIDASRNGLLEWSQYDDRVKILCQDPYVVNSEECMITGSSGIKDTSPMPNRIRKMATLRNIYMDHIQHYYKDFDYLCVMDMDLEGNLFLDGFFHGLGLISSKIDGVACNGMIKTEDAFYYYDSFAYVELHDPPFLSDIAEKSQHDNYVHTYMTQLYSSQMVPDRVQSAFGGCVLYRLQPMLEKRYDFSPDNFMCEHTFFHQGAKIYVDPRMIFFITKNG